MKQGELKEEIKALVLKESIRLLSLPILHYSVFSQGCCGFKFQFHHYLSFEVLKFNPPHNISWPKNLMLWPKNLKQNLVYKTVCIKFDLFNG